MRVEGLVWVADEVETLLRVAGIEAKIQSAHKL